MNKIKILYVMNHFSVGGGEAFCSNLALNLNKNIQVDFAVESFDEKSFFYQQLSAKNIHFYNYNSIKKKHSLLTFFKLFSLMKQGNYQVVHSHRDYFNGFILLIAFFAGIKKRISHAHLSKGKTTMAGKIYENIQKFLILCFATDLLACSQISGKFLYYKNAKFQIINNFIECDKFVYNINLRNSIRTKYNITNKFAVGHVGRFSSEKNHSFLIDIFSEIHKKNNNSVLLLVGNGPTESSIKQKITALNLTNNVFFTGFISNVSDLYQAMDCFVFPSYHEGLGIVAIEAECTGLPCFISDGVPEEANIVNTTKISLLKNSKEWAEIILEKTNNFERKDCSLKIKEANYDIKNIISKLEREYYK
jgi:glycosyltransferase involved in cell wall biosynthesis